MLTLMILSSSIIYLRSNVRVYRHRIMSLCWKIRSKIKHLIHKPLPKPSERTRKKSFFTLKMPEKGKIKPSKRFYPFLPRFNFSCRWQRSKPFWDDLKAWMRYDWRGKCFDWREASTSSDLKSGLGLSDEPQFWPLKKIKRTAVNVGSLSPYTIRK